MARDLLTLPMSTVVSKSYFGVGNRVLYERKSKINQQTNTNVHRAEGSVRCRR